LAGETRSPVFARFDVYLSVGVVREVDAQIVVDLPLEVRVPAPEDAGDVVEPGDQCSRFGGRECAVCWLASELAFEGATLAVDLGDPVPDHGCVGAGPENLPVTGQLGLALLQPPSQADLDRLPVVVGEPAGLGERRTGAVEVLVVE
jgi:hypothetical protein